MAITIKSLVRAVAETTKDQSLAQAVAGLLVVMFGICTGYSPSLPIMNGAIRWITHINVRVHVVAIICIFDIHSVFLLVASSLWL